MDNGIPCHKSAIYNVAWIVGLIPAIAVFIGISYYMRRRMMARMGMGGGGGGFGGMLGSGGGLNYICIACGHRFKGRSMPTLRKQNAQGRLLTHDP